MSETATVDTPSFDVLIARFGDEGARYAFERLIAQLVRLDHPDGRQVAVSQGDGGFDVISGSTIGDLAVWQSKFFYPSFKPAHRHSTAKSLAAAVKTAGEEGGTLCQWTLCVPVELDVKSQQWWDRLCTSNPAIEMVLWDRTALTELLSSRRGRDIRYLFFENPDPRLGMRVWPPATVAEADPETLGVARAAGLPAMPAYVSREIDEEIDRALAQRKLILIDGESAAGKSRTLLEALRRRLPDAEICAPSPSDLTAFVARVQCQRPMDRTRGFVLWLDDLDQFLRPGGLGLTEIESLLDDDVKVVATMRRQRHADLLDAGGTGAAVLDRATTIRLDLKPSAREQSAFKASHPARQLGTDGIGEHFVATRNLQQRYVTAPDNVRALTAMLIDWRRAAGGQPMPRPYAETVYSRLRADAGFDHALEAGRVSQSPGDAIVLGADDQLNVPDYLVDLDDREGEDGERRRDIAPQTWREFVAVALPDEAAAIAQAALDRRQPAIATVALRQARGSAHASVRAWTSNELAALLVADHPDEATELWLDALAEGDGVGVARAARMLIESAEEASEELDETIVDRIRQAILDSHDDLSKSDYLLLLAELAVRRDDISTLKELFSRSYGDNIADIGVIYARALIRADNRDAAADVLETVLDHAHEERRGLALLLCADNHLARADEDLAADMVIEAVELCGVSVAEEVNHLVRQFEDPKRLLPTLGRLADAGDWQAPHSLLMLASEFDDDVDDRH